MRHTILIATLSSVVASVLTIVVIGGSIFGAETASSANTSVEAVVAISPSGVTSILQGDINCDGVVDTHDTLGGLRFLGELDVPQNEPCPDIGTLAAIPGPAGPQGPAGPPGEQGPVGISDLEVVIVESAVDSSVVFGSKVLNALCPDGKKVLGGGVRFTVGDTGGLVTTESVPHDDLGGWFAIVEEATATTNDWGFRVSAICATVAE